ncbi:sulfur-oxidizing protein SoxY [Roseateles sp. YR242]|nr:sulfur-oxidizing protein SoxY [Roseateles sp. YR242]
MASRRLVLQTLSMAALLPHPAWANRAELEQAILAFTQGQVPRVGQVRLDVAPLIENGNAVPVTLSTTQPARALALFNELNPQREVLQARLPPGPTGARLATRIRLATSQQLVALAQTQDGRWWSHRVDVIVTLAACIEGG